MVEVGGSNPPGPTNKKPRHKRGFFIGRLRLDEIADTVRPNASWRAFRTERHRREARRVKTAKAVLSNPLGAANRLYFDREFTQ